VFGSSVKLQTNENSINDLIEISSIISPVLNGRLSLAGDIGLFFSPTLVIPNSFSNILVKTGADVHPSIDWSMVTIRSREYTNI